MATNRKKLKKHLFKLGVEAISVATGQEIHHYFCPICGNPFTEEDIDKGILTLEHIPPKAQGGKGIALTCVECNTTAGRKIDAPVAIRNHLLGISSLFSKQGQFNTRVRVDFGTSELESVNYELSVKDSAVRFYPVLKSNRPDYAENMSKFIKKLNKTPDEERTPWKMTTRKRFNLWHSKVGDLRSAFLVCFAAFGYNFAFDQALAPVRNQIQNYDEKVIDFFCLSLISTIEPCFKLGIVKAPFGALFCQLQNYAILFPWLNSPNGFYQYLKENSPENGHINFEWSTIPWPKTLEAKLDLSTNEK